MGRFCFRFLMKNYFSSGQGDSKTTGVVQNVCYFSDCHHDVPYYPLKICHYHNRLKVRDKTRDFWDCLNAIIRNGTICQRVFRTLYKRRYKKKCKTIYKLFVLLHDVFGGATHHCSYSCLCSCTYYIFAYMARHAKLLLNLYRRWKIHILYWRSSKYSIGQQTKRSWQ